MDKKKKNFNEAFDIYRMVMYWAFATNNVRTRPQGLWIHHERSI